MNWWDVLWVLFIVIPLVLFWGFALVDLFMRHDLRGWAKAGWLVAIIVFPVVGTLFYFIFRPMDVDMTYAERRGMQETAAYWDQQTTASAPSRAEQLSVLAGLHTSGQLSDSEYSAEKSRILSGA